MERDGVRLTVELDENPIRAGHDSWARLVVRNLGDDDVTWVTDGCGIPVSLYGRIGGQWIEGRAQTGIDAEFKALALQPLSQAGNSYLLIGSTAEKYVGRQVGCADTTFPHTLGPGRTIGVRRLIKGSFEDLPYPEGPVEWIASFPFESRERQPFERGKPIGVTVDGWVTGGQQTDILTPAQAVDAVLVDPEFAAWLEAEPTSTWINSSRTLDVAKGTWQIGLFRDGLSGGTWAALITIDARTGEVLERRFE